MRYVHVKPWLGILNRWILQWFFIRLAAIVETEPRQTGEDLRPAMPKDRRILGWQILYWVWPTSGWKVPYWCVGGRKMRHVTIWRKRQK